MEQSTSLHCLKCSHKWKPVRNIQVYGLPKVCPKCKNRKWMMGPKIPKMGRPRNENRWETGINDFFSDK